MATSVKVADSHEDLDGVPNEEFLWETLPGRCCFAGYMDTITEEWIGVSSCAECNVWSEPDNYCHKSAETCLKCGKPLYCPKPPPLITGNQVCIGRSRVGYGCFDEIDTGICGAKGLSECQEACRLNDRCEQLVFYPDRRAGSCVLCRDLVEVEDTHDVKTRIYANTPAPPPPAHPHGSRNEGWHLFPSPSPPSPPRPPPRKPSRPPAPIALAGNQRFECAFFPDVEFTVDTDRGYTDRVAASREECCNFCGTKNGCQDFVFEPGSGTCVLLPHMQDESKLVRTANSYTVAGSVKRLSTSTRVSSHAVCHLTHEAGFAQGTLGEAPPLPFGRPMETAQDCCDACENEVQCAHFSFEQFSKACILFAPFAQRFSAPGSTLVVGTVEGRSIEATLGNGHGGHAVANPYWSQLYGPPPAPPAFRTVSRPPPPPPPGELDAAKRIVAGFSLGVSALFALALTLCTYCFFSNEVLRMIHTVSGGRFGKPGRSPHSRLPTDLPEGDELRKMNKSLRKRQQAELAAANEPEDGAIQVTLETPTLTQRKYVTFFECVTLKEVMNEIFAEFKHALLNKKHHDMLLFCLVERPVDSLPSADPDLEEPDEIVTQQCWLLVSPRSNIELVLACAALKITEKPLEAVEYEYAFEPLFAPKPTKKEAAAHKMAARKAAAAAAAAEDCNRERFDDCGDDDEKEEEDEDFPGQRAIGARKSDGVGEEDRFEDDEADGDDGVDHAHDGAADSEPYREQSPGAHEAHQGEDETEGAAAQPRRAGSIASMYLGPAGTESPPRPRQSARNSPLNELEEDVGGGDVNQATQLASPLAQSQGNLSVQDMSDGFTHVSLNTYASQKSKSRSTLGNVIGSLD